MLVKCGWDKAKGGLNSKLFENIHVVRTKKGIAHSNLISYVISINKS